MKASESVISTQAEEDKTYWTHHIERHKSSGMTRKKYCRQNQVHYDRFNYWYGKLSPQPSPSSLVAVKVQKEVLLSTSLPVLCSLTLGNGKILNIHDLQVLKCLLHEV